MVQAMGSGRKPKANAQARQVFRSGVRVAGGNSAETTAGIGEGSEIDRYPTEITLSLVQLDLSVVSVSGVGDRVSVALAQSPVEVLCKAGRIGNVPPSWEKRVRDEAYGRGVVDRIEEHPPLVRVRLSG
jgi:hypothetical protein